MAPGITQSNLEADMADIESLPVQMQDRAADGASVQAAPADPLTDPLWSDNEGAAEWSVSSEGSEVAERSVS